MTVKKNNPSGNFLSFIKNFGKSIYVVNGGKIFITNAGEASVLMTMQEMSTAVQYSLPIKIFILNNEYMGMVRQ